MKKLSLAKPNELEREQSDTMPETKDVPGEPDYEGTIPLPTLTLEDDALTDDEDGVDPYDTGLFKSTKK